MSGNNNLDPMYVLGRSQRETERLQRQGQLLEPFTRLLFEAAGITTGMRVLDVGCGAGDVAFLVAKLVGPAGSVIGVDKNPLILETARLRACAAGLSNVTFVAGDIRDVILDQDFDAAVGRCILMYMADQAVALRAIARHLRPGGILAFEEADFSLTKSIMANDAAVPLSKQWIFWVFEVFCHTGFPLQISMSLPEAFRQADLLHPQMYMDAPAGLGADWAGYEYLAESLRSLLPLLVQFGITTEEEVAIDTFAERLRTEVVTQSSVVFGPVMIGTWAHKTSWWG
jgi:ubiquinone/menaquinone biosynthesis C-methylase UbiE